MACVDLTEINNWLQYCERPQDIPQAHVQFIILWVGFNGLYSAMYPSGRDNAKVKMFAKDSDVVDLYKKLTKKGGDMVSILTDFRKTKVGVRNSVLDMRFPDDISRVVKFDADNKSIEDFLVVIYQIRCNLFHADKNPSNELDQKVVEWAYRYLKILIDAYIKSLSPKCGDIDTDSIIL